MLTTRRIPIVEISEIEGAVPIAAAVGISNLRASQAMTRHLATKGYRKVGLVSTPPHGNDRLARRRLGYLQACEELGWQPIEANGPMTLEFGAQAVGLLTDGHPELDAIFCCSDTTAIGAIQECHRRGWQIPTRLAVAGYGDLDLGAQMFPRITTVHVPRLAMGRMAAQRLLELLSPSGEVPKVTDVGYRLIDRESA